MPIQPNFLERTAFFTLNAAPGPMLDLGRGAAATRLLHPMRQTPGSSLLVAEKQGSLGI